nr:arylsulfatase B [Helicoverpa armigera]
MFEIIRNNMSWKQWWIILTVVSKLISGYRQGPSHIVFIMVDDMGWNDVSFHGSDQILTPNIDALAYHSVILQQYYSEAICTPARTALLTGKYPMRLGMHGQPLFNSEDRGIPLTERLLPSYLKDLGYSTHLVGKWHVGMSKPEYLPTSRGYDHHYGMRGGYVDYYTYNKVETWPNGRLMFGLDLYDDAIPQDFEQRYIVDALTEKAVKIIHHHNASQPLFLHVTHNAPHAGNAGGALQPPLYSAVKHQHIANSDRRLYAEIVTHVDRSVGKIVQALSNRGILDDTIIVFASDNGAPTVGDLRNWGVNLPFRGKKYTPWEGGVRVPAFIWQSALRPRVWQGLMHISDWLPTLITAAGGKVPTGIDGVSQWESIVQSSASKRSEVLIAVEDSSTNSWAAYRAGDYKIVVGNVTGVSNGYYGSELLANKKTPPEYYPSLLSCSVTKAFEDVGLYLDFNTVRSTRKEATIKQEDTVRDATPCVPTPTRGCLFNVRRDPSESHDLWNRAGKIATLLTSRLRGLWATQQRRGTPRLNVAADPANYNYVWTPWLTQNNVTNQINANTNTNDGRINNFNLSFDFSQQKTGNKNTTVAAVINCDGDLFDNVLKDFVFQYLETLFMCQESLRCHLMFNDMFRDRLQRDLL